MEPSTTDIVSASVFSDALFTDGDPATALVSAADSGTLRPAAAAPVVDRGVSQVVHFLNAPIWEFALVAAAVLIISVLIGARLIEALSNRDLDLDPMAALSGQETADETDEPVDDEPTHTYEAYISPDTPDELLSDRGQIIRILVENDGRTYQYRIVEETGWSKSKVSRLLSEMHERGEVGKVSVGRENAIVLADHGPDGSDQADDPSVAVRKSPQ
ncbi:MULTISPECIES: helix-turn-helix transcriptional regulator [Natrialbaceae]|uniref:helix-turn-helix transcriptional regulator n=1 Tax=Natrialbaceae TaxID=1644061 RepID=UPI00207D257B|nr:MarR family transcriptional regulator [Natronococcus sp. CG52]